MTIDLVPNKYASITAPDDDSDTDDSESDSDEEPASLKNAREARDGIVAEIALVTERRSSAERELSILEQYATSTASSTGEKTTSVLMKEALELYTTGRKAVYDMVSESTKQLVSLEKDRAKAQQVLEKEEKKFAKANRPKAEAREKNRVDREERRREHKENKPEKSKNVHRVRITIELPWGDIDETVKDFVQEATLHLTYTTTAASWTPHYDLRLDTLNPSLSSLTYRAHFTNHTFETWSNARITLSTSQASFGGISERIPKMEAWRVTLSKRNSLGQFSDLQGEDGLYSHAENKVKEKERIATELALSKEKKKSKPKDIIAPAMRGALRSATVDHYAPTIEDADDKILLQLEDGTIAQQAPISHAAAESDTYGFTTTYELPTSRTIVSSHLVRRHVIAEMELPKIVFTHILIPKLKAAAYLKAKLTNTSSIPLLPGVAGLTLDGSFMGNLSFPRSSPSETVTLEIGIDQSVKVEYERPTVVHGTQGIIIGKEEVGIYKRATIITNSKGAAVSLVLLDQVPVPQNDKLKVNIALPRGLRNVDDVVKNVGVDGKTVVGKGKRTEETTAWKQKLEDIPETSSLKGSVRRTLSFSGKRDSVQKLSADGPTATVTASSASTWGTARATLRKNGEVRWDVDLAKGGCVALGLEWECRMPGGTGIYGLS